MPAPTDEAEMACGAGPPARHAGAAEGDRFWRRFAADPLTVRDVLRAAVARFARGISPEDAGVVELALGEVLNNIVEHAYAGHPGGPVEIALQDTGRALDCRIVDHGRPMPKLDLSARTMPPTDVPLCDLAEGGWGWVLVRELTEGLSYRREDDRNCLTFRIPFGPR